MVINVKEYILKEKSDGSVITVRQLQNVLLQMLKDIDEVCQKNNIPYWLTGGSALGAVRHEGFIPWDDDADIGMMREDYERFLTVVHQLPDQYVIQSYESHKEYNVLIPPMKIRLKGTYCREANFLLKNKCQDSDGIFIDVFIVDHVSENKFKDVVWRCRNGFLMIWIALFENLHINPTPLKNRFVRNAKKYGEINKNTPMVGYDLTWTFNSFFHPVVYPYDSIFPTKYMKFEDTKLPVPKEAEFMLNAEVGQNYMSYPPVNAQVPKHIKDIEL